MQALAKRAGPINLFSSNLVQREKTGWVITDAGRRFLTELEANNAPLPRPTSEGAILRLVSSRAVAESTHDPRALQPSRVRQGEAKLLATI